MRKIGIYMNGKSCKFTDYRFDLFSCTCKSQNHHILYPLTFLSSGSSPSPPRSLLPTMRAQSWERATKSAEKEILTVALRQKRFDYASFSSHARKQADARRLAHSPRRNDTCWLFFEIERELFSFSFLTWSAYHPNFASHFALRETVGSSHCGISISFPTYFYIISN